MSDQDASTNRIDDEKLRLEKRRLKIESSFVFRNSGVIISGFFTLAAAIFSISQAIIASIDKNREIALVQLQHLQTLEAAREAADREWTIRGADFIIENMEKIFGGSYDDQVRYRNIIIITWPKELSEKLFAETITASTSANSQVWKIGLDILTGLGSLSERYESNGNPSAIGHGKNAGWSYGLYQLSTKHGTIKLYLEFLEANYPSLAKTLTAAGGNQGALAGANEFKKAWRGLADSTSTMFADSQRAFIRETHYEPMAQRLLVFGLDIGPRSMPLKNVVWSVAVQHGPRSNIIKTALTADGRSLSTLSDEQIINMIYDERSKVDKYFARSTEEVKKSLRQRFQYERATAIEQLKQS